MSSKEKKEKELPESISIDTTILKINIKTTGDLITKEYDLIPFHPNMADLRDLSNNSYILFPSFVKVTMKDIKKAGVGQDYPNVFMNLDKYVKLMKYVTNPDKEEDPTLLINKTQVKNYAMSLAQTAVADLMADTTSDVISIQKTEPLTDEEIVVNNIELIKNIFLSPKSHFFILDNDYVIGESKYIPPYKTAGVNEKLMKETPKTIPLSYTVTFELQLLDAVNNPDAGDFSKMTCKAKKGNIAKDMKDIFGTDFGYVPEKKVTIPSILNTTKATQRRQFGKLQKEWEERNKYMKAPTNEKERKKMEESWTPLQRKMADFDKTADEYNKIPPMWVKESDELDKKYEDQQKELVKFWQEIVDIKKEKKEEEDLSTSIQTSTFQKDRMDAIKAKMTTIFKELLVNAVDKGEEDDKKIEDEIMKLLEKSNMEDVESELINYFTENKALEQKAINTKYLATLTKEAGLDEKKKDLAVLKESQAALLVKKDTSDNYTAASLNVEIEQIQAQIRKKQTDIEFLEQKYKKSADNWINTRLNMKKMRTKIETEKNKEEKEELNKTLKEELSKLMKKIKNEEDDLLLAGFKEGHEEIAITREEKNQFTKKDRPSSKYAELKSEVETLKQKYLERSGKLGFYNKIQGEITLLTMDMDRFTKIKKDKESEKSVLDRKIRDFSSELSKISSNREKAIETTRGKIIDKEQTELQNTIIEKFDDPIKKLKEKIKLYEKYINELKKIPEKNAEYDFNHNYKTFLKFNEEVVSEKTFEARTKEENEKIKEIEKIEKNEKERKREVGTLTPEESEKIAMDKKLIEEQIEKINTEKKDNLLAEITNETNLKPSSVEQSAGSGSNAVVMGAHKYIKRTRTRKQRRTHKHRITKRVKSKRKNHTLRKWRRLKKYLRKKKRTLRRSIR